MVNTASDQIMLPPVQWNVGEHVCVIGDTGSGKTYLMSQLAKLRKYVVILRTKPDDIVFKGFVHEKRAASLNNIKHDHILIDLTKMRTMRHLQGWEARQVLDKVWDMGRWTVFLDEGFYLQRKLGLVNELEMLMTQSRSLKVSVVVGMQRPAWVTRFAITEARHVISFRVEGRDLAIIKESTTANMAEAVRRLPRYHFAHFHRGTGEIRIGDANHLPRVFKLPPATL